MCSCVKFKAGRNLLQLLKIVKCTVLDPCKNSSRFHQITPNNQSQNFPGEHAPGPPVVLPHGYVLFPLPPPNNPYYLILPPPWAKSHQKPCWRTCVCYLQYDYIGLHHPTVAVLFWLKRKILLWPHVAGLLKLCWLCIDCNFSGLQLFSVFRCPWFWLETSVT